MKVEKINENLIEFSVNNDELKNRNIDVKDLTYGSEKAKSLIEELLSIAGTKVGFKVDGPISVEAIPLKDGAIKLIVSKVVNPDELDSRYSRFTPYGKMDKPISILEMLESTIDQFEDILKSQNVKGINEVKTLNRLDITKENEIVYIFEFENIDRATEACKNVSTYEYESIFYKDEKNNKYYLVLCILGKTSDATLKDFNKVCNSLAEYGSRVQSKFGMNKAYYDEHYKTIIKSDAVKKLSSL